MSEQVTLEKPFEFEGETINEVAIGDLTGKDIMGAFKEMAIIQKERGLNDEPSAIETAAFMAAKAVKLPYEALEAMKADDFIPLVSRFVPLVMSMV